MKAKAALLVAVTSFALIFTALPASASRNGIERKNNTFSVGITFKLSGVEQVCSGALLSPTVIVTAAHCIYDEVGAMGTDYYFTKPGVALDAPIDPSAKKVKILRVYTKPGFVTNAANQLDDVTFIELDSPLATAGFIRIATSDEIAKLTAGQTLKGYGFGHVYETNAPYAIYAREYSINWEAPPAPLTTVQINGTTSVACSGDSGGPLTTTSATGEEIVVAVMSGAARVVNKCGTAGSDGRYIMQATVVDSYSSLKPVAATPKITTATKKYKITCVKGKVKKFVTGTKPKCPTGYKQTAKVLVK